MVKRRHNSPISPPAVREKVWDTPVRLFHWTIAGLVATSWFTAEQGLLKIHLWSGLTLLTLLLFRVVWGLVGSTTARFGNFLHPPATVLGYLKSLRSGNKRLYAGHNPAGGWMVMTLIAALLTQVATGLFANDGLHFNGPLAIWVSTDTSDRLTALHGDLFNVLLLLVWLHLVAVFFYWLVKGENLIVPMITGHKSGNHVPPGLRLRFVHTAVAFLILVAIAGAVEFALM